MGDLNTTINVDLHIHSCASAYKEGSYQDTQTNIVAESNENHLDTLFKKLEEKKINLFAFSDHNCFNLELYKKAKAIVDDNSKYPTVKGILPSIECDVRFDEKYDKVHVFTIFDARTEEDLKRISKNFPTNDLIKDESERLTPETQFSKEIFEKKLKRIGLNTIYIACQRTSLTKKENTTNSLSGGVENPFELLDIGYINALEYQKPQVEGILKKDLSNKDLTYYAKIAGSDCHDWNVYPLHDRNDSQSENSRYFTIKALPNFLGLLLAITSPETRFNPSIINHKSIPYFELNGTKYPLSDGINTIIGENGGGKTTLITGLSNELNDKKFAYAKGILKESNFTIPDESKIIKKTTIKQAQLIEESNKNPHIFGDSAQFPKISYSIFESETKKYSSEIWKILAQNIKHYTDELNLKDREFEWNEGYEIGSSIPYYITIEIDDNFSNKENPIKERLEEISVILNKIKNEFNNSFYSELQKEKIKNAHSLLLSLWNELNEKYLTIEYDIKIRSLLNGSLTDYNKKIYDLSSSIDQKQNNYYEERKNFINSITKAVRSTPNVDFSSIKPIEKPTGEAKNEAYGFTFVTRSAFENATDNLSNLFLEYVFDLKDSDLSELKKIRTEEDLKKALKTKTKNPLSVFYNEKTNSFIKEYEEEEFEVFETTKENEKKGNTLGEKALVFYKYLTKKESENFSCILIDQPEDNLSNSKIYSELISYLNEIRKSHQIILVTHNPLLVVNLDSDNVIIVKKAGRKIEIEANGCLETTDMLENISKKMDGGAIALKRRLSLYESQNNIIKDEE